MNFMHKMKTAAIAAATALTVLASAAPASAATYYYQVRYFYSGGNYGISYNYKPYTYFYNTYKPTYTNTTTQRTTTSTPTTTVKPAPTTTAPTTNTTSTVSGLTAAEQQMLNLVNQERAKNGLAPLKADLQLTKLARMKSQDMINKNYFSHTSPTYGSPFDMMKTYGVTYRTAGENLAGNSTVTGAHTALMNSSGHRANILNSQYTHVGVGIVDGGQYGKMFTQMFVGR